MLVALDLRSLHYQPSPPASPCLSPLAGTLKARARVTLAGAIIACVALGALLLVIGIFDEAQGVAARRGGTGAVGLPRLGFAQPQPGGLPAAAAKAPCVMHALLAADGKRRTC